MKTLDQTFFRVVDEHLIFDRDKRSAAVRIWHQQKKRARGFSRDVRLFEVRVSHADITPHEPAAGAAMEAAPMSDRVQEARAAFVCWLEGFTVLPTMTYSQVDANLDAFAAAVRSATLAEVRRVLAEHVEDEDKGNTHDEWWARGFNAARREALTALDRMEAQQNPQQPGADGAAT